MCRPIQSQKSASAFIRMDFASITTAALLLVCMTLSSAAVSEATQQWVPLGPEGGNIGALAIDPQNPSTLYVALSGGVFKSTNGGASWSVANSGLLRSGGVDVLVIDLQNPTTLYAGMSRGVFKSTNGGASWGERAVPET